jgi:hypothetical protein
MKNIRKLALILIIFTLTFAPLYGVKAQQLTENMQTFFDREIPGIKITVSATAETQPNENITVKIAMNPLVEVNIEYFNFSVFGFLNGTYKTMIYNITVNNFPFNDTFPLPEQVWGVTFGEITLTYDVTYVIKKGIEITITIPYENLTVGFDMTRVKNVYLETVEEQLRNLNSTFEQLNQTFWESFQMKLSAENLARLNQTYWELQQNYTALRGNLNELGNTRMAVGILAVTTVFFVATTLYLVMRKPKESW